MALSVGHPMEVISSHPMGLISIADTVPGTFGIPNVPMDICWQCWPWACVPFLSSRTKPGHIYILYTRCTIHDGNNGHFLTMLHMCGRQSTC